MRDLFETLETENCEPTQDIKDTPYFKWLAEQKVDDINKISTKLKYLNGLGFDQDVHRISSDYLECLNYIEQAYCRLVLVPIWDAERLNKK